MLVFNFTVEPSETPLNDPAFSLGHLEVRDKGASISSSLRLAMMLFPSLSQLLDGIRYFLAVQPSRSYTFVAIDSSFGLRFTKDKSGNVIVTSPEAEIRGVPPTELVVSLWEGVNKFLNDYDVRLNVSGEPVLIEDAFRHDLKNSIDSFRVAFKL